MGKFDGKKLLVLGSNVSSTDIVEYARREGAYVIVTDYLPTEKSKAKQYADETAMISTLDVDALVAFAREKKVDGVFSGVSEQNILAANAVATRIGAYSCFTREQWDLCENKAEFKALCEKHGVPVAKRFKLSDIPTEEELAAIEYPVIVKPVDQSAAIGIHICRNEQQLLDGYRDACNKAFCHKALVEQYVVGIEFSAHYTFINGECRLSAVFDKYLDEDKTGFIPLPEAYVFPSRIQEKYIREADEHVREMFLSIGVKNGMAFIQGVVDGEKLAIFEAGLRMGGTAMYNFVERINGISTVRLMTDYALLGRTDEDISLEDVRLKGKRGCLLSVLNRGGTIGMIKGYDEACKVQGVVSTQMRYKEGDTIPNNGTLQQSHLRFYVIRDSAEELRESVKGIQELLSVTDTEGNNMLLTGFDADKLIY